MFLSRLIHYFIPEQKESKPSERGVCTLSPFNNQYNKLALAYAHAESRGASPSELRDVIAQHPITTTEGQWALGIGRRVTPEEHARINELVLGH